MNDRAPPQIFDSIAAARAQARAVRRGVTSFLWQEALEGMAHRLGAVTRRFGKALEIGRQGDALRQFGGTWTKGSFDASEKLIGVGEGNFDLIVSTLELHRMNDLPGALIQIRRALKPDGFFLASLFGGDTLNELRESLTTGESAVRGGASPHILSFADVRDLGGLLQRAGFALPVADTERTNVVYRNIFSLARDLRDLGETNILMARDRKGLSRATLGASLAHYAANYGDDQGRFRATFEVVFLAGWAPHESQQKPLKPGSAKMRLADALKTDEKKL